jgi:hypothetical protein
MALVRSNVCGKRELIARRRLPGNPNLGVAEPRRLLRASKHLFMLPR